MAPIAGEPQEVVIQLLDSASGRAVKLWKFRGRESLSIGRLPENDVEIHDPYVSRLHAEVVQRDGQWVLVACGRHGVLVDNQPVTERVLEHDVIFQLGRSGPVMRFQLGREDSGCGHTLTLDDEHPLFFGLDETRIQEEVDRIAEGDYFRRLQAEARNLRARQQPGLR
ncbi:MAG: FHA domain-containing protein [Pirellulaceae bacterium]